MMYSELTLGQTCKSASSGLHIYGSMKSFIKCFIFLFIFLGFYFPFSVTVDLSVPGAFSFSSFCLHPLLSAARLCLLGAFARLGVRGSCGARRDSLICAFPWGTVAGLYSVEVILGP